ncbi:Hypothetical protein A7982_08617 [Minicystis rosea]|nr:Hypothetical protein A7982_08617 [Minicystis rosea]
MPRTMLRRKTHDGSRAPVLTSSAAAVTLLLVGNDRAVRLVHTATPLEAIVLMQTLEEAAPRELSRTAIAVDGAIVHERKRAADGFHNVDDDC